MDTNSFDLFFNIITLGCGVYCLYVWFQLRRQGLNMPKCPLVPTDQTPSECLDPEAYVAYMLPKTLVLGIVVLLTSVLGLMTGTVLPYTMWLQLVVILLPLAVLVWFCICFTKARKEYW